MDITKKKIIFIDLDDCLIKTRTGQTFPEGVWDMEMNLDVFENLKRLHPLAVLIVTNQGGIELGYVPQQLFEPKFIYVIASLQQYIGFNTLVAGQFCASNDPKNTHRKPNVGMLDSMIKQFEEQAKVKIKKEDCIMIGDASGLPGNFSDSDKKTAENFGCDYMDVNDFIKLELPEPLFKVVYLSNGEVATEGDTKLENLTESVAKETVKRLNEPKQDYTYAPQNWVAPKIEVKTKSGKVVSLPKKSKK